METSKENKMGTMPINKLLFNMSLPIIVSMLVQALYNIVDSIFVSRFHANALTAVTLAFPIQNLMIAVGVGTSVGVNALLSRNLGARKAKEANLTASNGVFLAVLSYFVFALFGIFFARFFFESQFSAADFAADPINTREIIDFGTSYLQVCTIFSFGLFMQIMVERLLQSTGQTIYNMITQGTGAIINIILDPILIFGYLGFPALGVKGAAIATVIGQVVGMLLSFYFNHKKNHEIKVQIKGFKPHMDTIKSIYSVGLPSIVMQSIGSLMVLGVNSILLVFSPLAVSVFGIYFRLQSFIFMPIIGLNNGMVPIIAYNYGARNKKRIIDTIKLSAITAIIIMLAGLLVFQTLPTQLLSIFKASQEMIAIGIPALRFISLSFLFAGYCIVMSSVFQALGNGVYSLIISVIRQLVVILPVAYFLANVFGLNMVWLAFPIAEIASVLLCTFFLKRIYTKKLKHL